MGVYIKGMEMPKDHLSCPFRGAITERCIVSEKWCNGFNKDCPLVEVKEPHGDLIKRLRNIAFYLPSDDEKVLDESINFLAGIIEAEGKDDG